MWHVHVLVCEYTHLHMCMWRPKISIMYLPQSPSTLCFETCLEMNLELRNLVRLAGQRALPMAAYLRFFSNSITLLCLTSLRWVLGIRSQSLMLA